MPINIEQSWRKVLHQEFTAQYFQTLSECIRNFYLEKLVIYPNPKNIFLAFELCPFDVVSVVILGQDPYHGAQQAHGLCFSVQDGLPIPPSLKNIYKEMHDDLGIEPRTSGDLRHWAKQGVLLLNATLTVEAGKPGSHQGLGWEKFTDAVIKKISDEKKQVVFILWGKYAQNKGAYIDTTKHLVLTAAHPSPFSAYAGFFGCKHFSKTNKYLLSNRKQPITW